MSHVWTVLHCMNIAASTLLIGIPCLHKMSCKIDPAIGASVSQANQEHFCMWHNACLRWLHCAQQASQFFSTFMDFLCSVGLLAVNMHQSEDQQVGTQQHIFNVKLQY